MKCNLNCFNCEFDDCINGEISLDDIKQSKKLDKETLSKPITHKQKVIQAANKRYYDKNRDKLSNRPLTDEQRQRKINKSREYYQKHREELIEYNKAAYRAKRERQAV